MKKINYKNNTKNFNDLDTKSNRLNDTFIKKSGKDLRKGFDRRSLSERRKSNNRRRSND